MFDLNVDAVDSGTISGASAYTSQYMSTDKPILSKHVGAGDYGKVMATLFKALWEGNNCHYCTLFSVIPMYVSLGGSENPYYGDNILSSPDPADAKCERVLADKKPGTLMEQSVCKARQGRLDAVKMMFPVGDEEEEDTQVDVAYIHTWGWCEWWYVQSLGWKPARGLPSDDRRVWFYPVSAAKKAQAGAFNSKTWSTEPPFGDKYKSGETKFGTFSICACFTPCYSLKNKTI